MEPVKTFDVSCTSCPGVYNCEVPASQTKRVKAAKSNAEIWMQTHCDTTGHTRFRYAETYGAFRIVSRGQGPQMLLSEDPDYSTFRL